MSDQPIHPAIARVVRSLQEMSMQDDPFCCGHEAVSYVHELLSDLKEAGVVDLKWEAASEKISQIAADFGMDYVEELMEIADMWVRYGEKDDEYLIDSEVLAKALPEFWDAYEIVTSTTVPPEKRTESFFAQTDEEE